MGDDYYFITPQDLLLLPSITLQKKWWRWGKRIVERKSFKNIMQSEYQDTTASCIDRGHMNYAGYQNAYQDRVPV